MRGTTMRAASICAALLGMSGLMVACGDDNGGVDSGIDSGPRDAGQDAGEAPMDAGDGGGTIDDAGIDAQVDAGPPPANLRLAHLISGGPDVHVCVQIPAGVGMWTLITRNAANVPTAIPYRGISNYVNRLPLPAPITLGVRVFPETAITGPSMDTCPTAATDALIDTTIDGSMFTGGDYYTIAATGLPGGTLAAEPALEVLHDDLTAPAAGMTRLRVYHAIPNLPVTAVDLCVDPDGPTNPAPAEQIVDNLSFEGASAYVEHAPITTGIMTVHIHTPDGAGLDCNVTPATSGGTLLMMIPVPLPVPSGAGIPANIVDTFDADSVNTLFAAGDYTYSTSNATCTPATMDVDCPVGAGANPDGTVCSPLTMRCSNPRGPTVIPWRDDIQDDGTPLP